eukprot:gene5052-7053_t
MGGGNSSIRDSIKGSLQKSEAQIVRVMMPVYFTAEEVNHTEHEICNNSWQMILNDTSPEFLVKKQNLNPEQFPYSSSITFFYDSFYARLFDIHPMSRGLFKNGIKSQGKFLVKMITLSLSELNDFEKFEKTLVKLAEIHNERGVKAIEYGIVGEVLFWALRNCLGDSVYTPECHFGWTKIYSRMLRTMVPVAVAHELNDNSTNQNRRLDELNNSEGFHNALSVVSNDTLTNRSGNEKNSFGSIEAKRKLEEISEAVHDVVRNSNTVIALDTNDGNNSIQLQSSRDFIATGHSTSVDETSYGSVISDFPPFNISSIKDDYSMDNNNYNNNYNRKDDSSSRIPEKTNDDYTNHSSNYNI